MSSRTPIIVPPMTGWGMKPTPVARNRAAVAGVAGPCRGSAEARSEVNSLRDAAGWPRLPGRTAHCVASAFAYGAPDLVNGVRPKRYGNGSPAAQPLGVFAPSDGEFQMTVAGDRVWKRFAEHVHDRPDLIDDPLYASNPDRVRTRDQLLDMTRPRLEP